VEVCHAREADFRTGDVDRAEVGPSLQVNEPGISHSGAIEGQHRKVLQSAEVYQIGVADLGPVKNQSLEANQLAQLLRARVRDVGA
jgi:hypothetical protein